MDPRGNVLYTKELGRKRIRVLGTAVEGWVVHRNPGHGESQGLLFDG